MTFSCFQVSPPKRMVTLPRSSAPKGTLDRAAEVTDRAAVEPHHAGQPRALMREFALDLFFFGVRLRQFIQRKIDACNGHGELPLCRFAELFSDLFVGSDGQRTRDTRGVKVVELGAQLDTNLNGRLLQRQRLKKLLFRKRERIPASRLGRHPLCPPFPNRIKSGFSNRCSPDLRGRQKPYP